MLARWGLSGMEPFDQVSVKAKERFPVDNRLEATADANHNERKTSIQA